MQVIAPGYAPAVDTAVVVDAQTGEPVTPEVASVLPATNPEIVAVRAGSAAPTALVWALAVTVSGAFATVKLWDTGVAALYVESPACEAWIVHNPPARRCTVEPATVHTGVV